MWVVGGNRGPPHLQHQAHPAVRGGARRLPSPFRNIPQRSPYADRYTRTLRVCEHRQQARLRLICPQPRHRIRIGTEIRIRTSVRIGTESEIQLLARNWLWLRTIGLRAFRFRCRARVQRREPWRLVGHKVVARFLGAAEGDDDERGAALSGRPAIRHAALAAGEGDSRSIIRFRGSQCRVVAPRSKEEVGWRKGKREEVAWREEKCDCGCFLGAHGGIGPSQSVRGVTPLQQASPRGATAADLWARGGKVGGGGHV